MSRATSLLTLYGAGFLLATCSATPALTGNATPPLPPASCAVVEGKPSAQDLLTAQELQRNIKTSPLYTIPAANGLASCRIRYQDDAVVVLEYQFKEGGWLHVKRDQRIEYTEQNASFTLPSNQKPEAVLAGAERSAFGDTGCGIAWREPETRPAENSNNLTETVFRGDVCNCQAVIRRQADGRVVGLMLKSAC